MIKGRKQKIKTDKYGCRFVTFHGRIFNPRDFENSEWVKKNWKLTTFKDDARVRIDQINDEIDFSYSRGNPANPNGDRKMKNKYKFEALKKALELLKSAKFDDTRDSQVNTAILNIERELESRIANNEN